MAKAHYVNNADFLAAIIEYKKSVVDAEESGDPKPQLSEYIGECLMKIARGVSQRANFANYTYRDDMVLDGVENCLLYFDNFDPIKYSNPFGYYGRIIWFAFLRRILREKKQMLIKGKILQEMPFNAYDLQVHDEDGIGVVESYLETMRHSGAYNDVVVKDEERKAKAKAKKNAAMITADLIEEELAEVIAAVEAE